MNTSPIFQRIHLKAGKNPDINSLKQRDLRADFKRLPALLCLGHFFLNGTLDSHFSRPVTSSFQFRLFISQCHGTPELRIPCPRFFSAKTLSRLFQSFFYSAILSPAAFDRNAAKNRRRIFLCPTILPHQHLDHRRHLNSRKPLRKSGSQPRKRHLSCICHCGQS